MKKTKHFILDTSLRLFNQHGLAKTTLRTIAKEMNISQGNLNYHFKKREDIIEMLYFQLVAKMDESIKASQEGPFKMKTMYDQFKITMTNFYEYRFFMLDFVTVMRAHEKIRAHYNELVKLRKNQFLGIFSFLTKLGIIRKEEFSGEYESLNDRLQILGDFWLSSEIVKNDLTPKAIEKYANIIFQSFYPYLTAKGKKEYKKSILDG